MTEKQMFDDCGCGAESYMVTVSVAILRDRGRGELCQTISSSKIYSQCRRYILRGNHCPNILNASFSIHRIIISEFLSPLGVCS
jgi:hypothetical protein